MERIKGQRKKKEWITKDVKVKFPNCPGKQYIPLQNELQF
jgi:hypothetical protein